MKLHQLEIEGFGIFKDRQTIDFDNLGSEGLFLLDGPTGAGKSTIIDAIVWVLYGTTAQESAIKAVGSRSAQEGRAKDRIRSAYCGPEDATEVSVTFSNHGKKYRVRRTPTFEVPKKRGEGTTEQKATVKFEYMEPGGEPITAIKEAAEKIVEIIGLDEGQFAQLVVLPQGAFAKFLQASSDERKMVLEKVFRPFIYQRIEELLKDRWIEIFRQREDLQREFRRLSDNFWSHLNLLKAEDVEAKRDQAILSDANEAIDRKKELLSEYGMKFHLNTGDLDNELQRTKAVSKDADNAVFQTEKLVAYVKSRDGWTSELAELRKGEESIQSDRALLKRIESTKHLRPLLDAVDDATEVLENAESAWGQFDFDFITQVEMGEEIQRASEASTPFDKLSKALTLFEKEVERLDGEVELATSREEDLITNERLLISLSADLVSADKRLAEARQNQINFHMTQLLMGLVEGKACPLCGSLSHPTPFAEDEAGLKTLDLKEFEEGVRITQRELDSVENILKNLKVDKNGAPWPSSRHYAAVLMEAIEKSKLLSSEVEKVGQERTRHQDLLRAKSSLDALIGARETLSKLSKSLKEEIVRVGLADREEALRIASQDSNEVKERIMFFDEQLGRLVALLNQEWIRSLTVVRGEAEENRNKALRAQIEATRAFDEIKVKVHSANVFNEEIIVRRNACICALDEYEVFNEEHIAIERLASLARGDNRENLSLTSFILQERLESILAHASLHLRRISQDKYELEPLYEGIGQEKRSGLGITVVDRYTAQRRSPQSLSGGETFYASLALALGLAEVVRSEAGGVELGTLFIDEGFGSLDKETLETVLDVLDDLRGGNRVVGLISHVSEMKNWAPRRVDIIPSTTGGPSTIYQRL